MNIRSVSCIVLLLFQVWLVFKGVNTFGKYYNPVVLFFSQALLFVCYIWAVWNNDINERPTISIKPRILTAAGGVIAMLLCIALFRSALQQFADPGAYSDVLPQLVGQYERFAQGEFPYKKMNLPYSQPFPVYMPLHWLPIGITKLARINPVWIGYFLLIFSVALAGWQLRLYKEFSVAKGLMLPFLPAIILAAFLKWGHSDVPVTLETLIAAYYLILAVGICTRNLRLVSIGICLCLLSRYTLIFWLPLLMVVVAKEHGIKKALGAGGIMLLSLLAFYVVPFLLRDPSIFLTGLKYHNDAAIFEWTHGSWTFENGIYFAPHINRFAGGSIEHKVFVTRVLQGGAMILLTVGGLILYVRTRLKMNWYDLMLGLLYVFISTFYIISPLTYRYYLITPLMLAAVLCYRASLAARQAR